MYQYHNDTCLSMYCMVHGNKFASQLTDRDINLAFCRGMHSTKCDASWSLVDKKHKDKNVTEPSAGQTWGQRGLHTPRTASHYTAFIRPTYLRSSGEMLCQLSVMYISSSRSCSWGDLYRESEWGFLVLSKILYILLWKKDYNSNPRHFYSCTSSFVIVQFLSR